jgi:hypothetical protein
MKRPGKANYLLRILWLMPLILALACMPRPDISVDALPECDALFQNENGWTGADGAYSIMLSNDKILWVFGDTWIGQIKDGQHVNAVIVNNSIALQHGKRAADSSVEFYYGQTPEGKPAAFLRPPPNHSWFWIYDGVMTAKGLFLFLIEIERTDEASVFGFKIIGSWLGHVVNPEDPPPKWHLNIREIPWATISATRNTFFGSALLNLSGFIYIYGIIEDIGDDFHRKHMILARVPEGGLGDFNQWRFFAQDRWSSDFSEATRLCGNMANEYSVSYQPALKKYVVVYSENGISEKIVARMASKPSGPWSEPLLLYRCPEAGWHEDIFCYAAKAHADISLTEDELIITYVANSIDFQKVAQDARLYRPRFLRVRFKSSGRN